MDTKGLKCRMANWNLARRAGGQVVAGSAGSQAVTNVVCCRFTFGYRSVSLRGSINWNLPAGRAAKSCERYV